MSGRWRDVEVDFGEDETEVFGTRIEFSAANNLYQLQTLALISSQSTNVKAPIVTGASNGCFVALAADQDVSLFQIEPFKHVATLPVDAPVVSLLLVADSDILLVGLRNGVIHCFSALREHIFMKLNINKEDSKVGSELLGLATTKARDGERVYVYAVTNDASALIYSIPICLFPLPREAHDVKQGIQNIQSKNISFASAHVDISHFVALPNSPDLFVVGTGDCAVTTWTPYMHAYKVKHCLFKSHQAGLPRWRRLQCTSNGLFIVGLDMESQFVSGNFKGDFYLWDLWTGLIVFNWQSSDFSPDFQPIEFCLLEDDQLRRDFKNYRVLMLCKSKNDAMKKVEIRSLSEFSAIYSVVVSEHATLISCLPGEDMFFVLEAMTSSANNNGGCDVEQLRLRSLSEAQVDIRFTRLLNKRKFRDAEALAQQFTTLDIQLVYTTEANFIISSLTSEDADSVFVQLTQCLDKITAIDAIANCCMHAVFPSLRLTASILEYAQNRIKGSVRLNEAAWLLMEDIVKLAHRLETFRLCFGSESFTPDTWIKFSKQGVGKILQFLLSESRFDDAATFWLRHERDLLKDLTADWTAVLNAIPDSVESAAVAPWFELTFLPALLRTMPECVDDVARWIDQRTRNMEILEKVGWPQNAGRFAMTLQRVLSSLHQGRWHQTPGQIAAQAYILCVTKAESMDPSHAVGRLNRLIDQLHELARIHTVYNCKLSFASFIRETIETLCYRILDRTQALELIPRAIEQYAKPYMAEHKLDCDKVLFQYVLDILEQTSRLGYAGSSIWEDRTIAVIHCMPQLEYRLRSVLQVVKAAHVPWSPRIAAMVAEATKHRHPLVDDINRMCKLTELKLLLVKYDVRCYNTSELSHAKLLYRFILSRKTELNDTVVADALKVLEAHSFASTLDPYLKRCLWLIQQGQVSDATALLNAADNDIAVKCAARLISLIKNLVDTMMLGSADAQEQSSTDSKAFQERLSLLDSVPPLFRLFTNRLQAMKENHALSSIGSESCLSVQETKLLVSQLAALRTLQSDFDKVVRLRDYANAEFCEAMLEDYVQQYFTRRATPEPSNFSMSFSTLANESRLQQQPQQAAQASTCRPTWAKVVKLVKVLNMPKAKLLAKLMVSAVENGNVAGALHLAQELLDDLEDHRVNETDQIVETILLLIGDVWKCIADGQGHVIIDDEDQSALADVAVQLAQITDSALRLCTDDYLLSKFSAVSLWSHFAATVSRQCEASYTNTSLAKAGKLESFLSVPDGRGMSSSTTAGVLSFYKDMGLVMVSQQVMPLVFSVGHAIIFSQSNSTMAEKEAKLELLIAHLCQNNYLQFAIFVLLFAVNQWIDFIQAGEGLSALKRAEGLTISLIEKIVLSSSWDFRLCLAYFLLISEASAYSLLKHVKSKVGFNYKQMRISAQVAEAYALLHQKGDIAKQAKMTLKQATWGYKLSKLKISFKEVINGGPAATLSILKEFIKLPHASVCSVMKEYCEDFDIDADDALLNYLEHLLVQSNEALFAQESSLDIVFEGMRSLMQQAELVIRSLGHNKLLVLQDKFTALLAKIDTYNYEAFQLLLSVLQEHSAARVDAGHLLQILSFLKSYHRTKTANHAERQAYILFKSSNAASSPRDQLFDLGSMQSSPRLPAASNRRLPFRPFLEGKHFDAVMKLELDLSNARSWLAFSSKGYLKKTGPDTVLTQVVENALPGSDGQTLVGEQQCLDLMTFSKIKELLFAYPRKDVAFMCAVKVAKFSPPGLLKLEATSMCVPLARVWRDSCQEKCVGKEPSDELHKAQATLSRFIQLQQSFAAEAVLREHGFATAANLELAQQPSKLLLSLYESVDVISKTLEARRHRQQIAKIVKEIAARNNVNMDKIHSILLDKLLPPDSERPGAQGEESEDVTVDLQTALRNANAQAQGVQLKIETESLQRAIFILGQLPNAIDYILPPLQNGGGLVSNLHRVRLAKALFCVSSRETLCAALAPDTPEGLRDLMANLIYVIRFESCRIPHSISSFAAGNKEALVKGLWKNRKDPPLVELMASICIDYNIRLADVIDDLLTRLMSVEKGPLVEALLMHAHNNRNLWLMPNLPSHWSRVVGQKFELCCESSNKQEKLIKIFLACCLLIRSPVATRVAVMDQLVEQIRASVHCDSVAELCRFVFNRDYSRRILSSAPLDDVIADSIFKHALPGLARILPPVAK